MDDSTERDQIDEALVKYLHHSWTKDVEREIKDAYGPEIALKVKSLYDEAMDCPVDWHHENMDSALGILADFMTKEFPWLSGQARTRLNYCYIVAWK